MPRTTVEAVRAILQDNYGPRADGSLPDLQQFVDTATVVVSRVATQAALINRTLTADEAELVERWLAAHFYCVSDPLYMSRSTEGASGSFQRQSGGQGFETTDYGREAVRVDWSGVLSAIGKRQFARGAWLGKLPSAQVPVDQRE